VLNCAIVVLFLDLAKDTTKHTVKRIAKTSKFSSVGIFV